MDDLFGARDEQPPTPPGACLEPRRVHKGSVEEQTGRIGVAADGLPSGLPADTGAESQPSEGESQDADDGSSVVHATDPAPHQVEEPSVSGEGSQVESPMDGGRPPAGAADGCTPADGPAHRSLFDDQQAVASAHPTRKRAWMGDAPSRSILVTGEADHLGSLTGTAIKGDRDPLTTCETVMRTDDVSLAEIVSRGPDWLAQRLRQGLPHRHTGAPRQITKPEHSARRVFYALGRLKQAHPDDQMLPKVHVTKAVPKLSPMRLDREPKNFKNDLRKWGDKSRQERGRETGEGRALDDSTRHTYVENVRLMAGAANELGFVDELFGVGTLASSDVAEAVFGYLEKLFPPAVVAAMVASLTRISIDLFGDDPEHASDIDYLQAEAKDRFPDQALSENARRRYDDLLSDPLKMATIKDAPAAMMARAHAPSLKPADRVGRAARAFVAQLKLESPALEATQAAELDADVHLRREGGVLLLRLPDPRERGRFRWDPCTPAAEALLTGWLELKEEHGIAGSLFFPSEGDPAKPQIARVAMAGLYADFTSVTDEHLTFDEIKTLRCYKAIKAHPEKLRHITEAAGYKDPRSLGRRLGILLTRRRGRKAA